MIKKMLEMPKFKGESEEADWWASPAGRAYIKRKSAGSSLVASVNKKASVQIAIRLPKPISAQAREITAARGGYQPLKMFVREGLLREARRR